MITRGQLEKAFGDDRESFKNKDIQDSSFTVISLLRSRIPYSLCRNIIVCAEHDILYLCDVDHAIHHLTEEDLAILADCNCMIDEDNDCIALFV